MLVHLDFETLSRGSIKRGAKRYAEDASTRILCMGYAIENADPDLWRPGDPDPISFFDAIKKGALVCSHNAMFERMHWETICVPQFGWPEIRPEQWVCTAAKAAAMSLPRALGNAGKALRLEQLKDEAGEALMKRVTQPRKPTKNDPREWHDIPEALYDYCKQDVVAERALDHAVRDLTPKERQVWLLDQKINSYGIRVDLDLVNAALQIIEDYTEQLATPLQEITNGRIKTTGQTKAIVEFLAGIGVIIPNLQEATVDEFLAKPGVTGIARQLLGIRSRLNKTSVGKYRAISESVCADGRVYGSLIYHGAGPGRWAGQNIQLHNLPRGNLKDMDTAVKVIKTRSLENLEMFYDHPMEVLSSAIRGTIIPSEGHRLLVADYSAIEARMLFWATGDALGLRLFRDGPEPYKAMAADIYSTDVKLIGGDSPERQLGKQAILGLGYNMGVPKFLATCKKYGINISEALAARAVEIYRSKHRTVADFWPAMEDAAGAAIRTGRPQKIGPFVFFTHKGFLYNKLPSGRCIAYCNPHFRERETPWGQMKEQIHYYGTISQESSSSKKWGLKSTYGGKLTENAIQGIARDIMAEAMLRLDAAGYKVLLTVHDEIIAEMMIGQGSLEEYEKLLVQLPDWAEGCPIEAKGWEGDRYRKG